MTPTLSSIDQIAGASELAAVEILACTADTTRRALFATHPNIECAGPYFAETCEATVRECLATAIVTAIDLLVDAIEHYRAHVDNLAHLRSDSNDAEQDPF